MILFIFLIYDSKLWMKNFRTAIQFPIQGLK